METYNYSLTVGIHYRINLESNKTTGFSWNVFCNDQKMVNGLKITKEYIKKDTKLYGVGGYEVFTIQGLYKQTYNLTFKYMRQDLITRVININLTFKQKIVAILLNILYLQKASCYKMQLRQFQKQRRSETKQKQLCLSIKRLLFRLGIKRGYCSICYLQNLPVLQLHPRVGEQAIHQQCYTCYLKLIENQPAQLKCHYCRKDIDRINYFIQLITKMEMKQISMVLRFFNGCYKYKVQSLLVELFKEQIIQVAMDRKKPSLIKKFFFGTELKFKQVDIKKILQLFVTSTNDIGEDINLIRKIIAYIGINNVFNNIQFLLFVAIQEKQEKLIDYILLNGQCDLIFENGKNILMMIIQQSNQLDINICKRIFSRLIHSIDLLYKDRAGENVLVYLNRSQFGIEMIDKVCEIQPLLFQQLYKELINEVINPDYDILLQYLDKKARERAILSNDQEVINKIARIDQLDRNYQKYYFDEVLLDYQDEQGKNILMVLLSKKLLRQKISQKEIRRYRQLIDQIDLLHRDNKGKNIIMYLLFTNINFLINPIIEIQPKTLWQVDNQGSNIGMYILASYNRTYDIFCNYNQIRIDQFDYSYKNNNGQDLLYFAIKYNCEEQIQELIEYVDFEQFYVQNQQMNIVQFAIKDISQNQRYIMKMIRNKKFNFRLHKGQQILDEVLIGRNCQNEVMRGYYNEIIQELQNMKMRIMKERIFNVVVKFMLIILLAFIIKSLM